MYSSDNSHARVIIRNQLSRRTLQNSMHFVVVFETTSSGVILKSVAAQRQDRTTVWGTSIRERPRTSKDRSPTRLATLAPKGLRFWYGILIILIRLHSINVTVQSLELQVNGAFYYECVNPCVSKVLPAVSTVCYRFSHLSLNIFLLFYHVCT